MKENMHKLGRVTLAAGLWAMVGGGSVVAAPLPPVPMGAHPLELQLLADLPGTDGAVTDISHARDGTGRLFVMQSLGKVRVIENGSVSATPFLDLTGTVATSGPGMTSLTFHPGYADPSSAGYRKLYVATGEPLTNGPYDFGTVHFGHVTQNPIDTVVYEYQVRGDDPGRVDPMSKRQLMRVFQPARTHVLSDLTFGHDGHLYIAFGDGGGTGGNPTREYYLNAQDTTNVFGSVLRIDVDSPPTNGRYAIPGDNPFADDMSGNVPEIYAWGLRNPWRTTTDRLTGDIYVGNNGDQTIEDIERIGNGTNHGWALKEGSFLYDPATQSVSVDMSPDPGLTEPFAQYDHQGFDPQNEGSIIGGFVHRGSLIPHYDGQYIFADYTAGNLLAADTATGQLEQIPVDSGGFVFGSQQIIVVGEDERGELYIGGINADGTMGRVVTRTDNAVAASRIWDGGPGTAGTDWSNPENWDQDGHPAMVDDLTVMAGSPVSDSVVTVDDGGAILVVSSLASASFRQLEVGVFGRGEVVVNDGATVTVGETVTLGYGKTGDAHAWIQGAGSVWNVGGNLMVGQFGAGQLEVSDGAQVVAAADVWIGAFDGSTGRVEVSGAGSRLDVGAALHVGGKPGVNGGAGQLSIGSQSTVAVTGPLVVHTGAIVQVLGSLSAGPHRTTRRDRLGPRDGHGRWA